MEPLSKGELYYNLTFLGGEPAGSLDTYVVLGALPPEDGPGGGFGEGGAVGLAGHPRTALVAPQRLSCYNCRKNTIYT